MSFAALPFSSLFVALSFSILHYPPGFAHCSPAAPRDSHLRVFLMNVFIATPQTQKKTFWYLLICIWKIWNLPMAHKTNSFSNNLKLFLSNNIQVLCLCLKCGHGLIWLHEHINKRTTLTNLQNTKIPTRKPSWGKTQYSSRVYKYEKNIYNFNLELLLHKTIHGQLITMSYTLLRWKGAFQERLSPIP